MKELIPIVVDLLSKHTCVIVPDFGGFIVNEKSAVVDAAGDRFFPPRKELIFNSHLSHNDGLLAHALMQKKNISFNDANQIITEKVKSVKRELDTHKIYSLGDFGFFSLETTGVIFHAKEIQIEDVEAFGLREFYFPTLQAEKNSNSSAITPSISKAIMGGIAATVALFLFCQPLKNEGGTNQASLFPVTFFSETAIYNAELLERERALQESAKTKELNYLVVEELESEEEALAFANSLVLQQGDTIRILSVGGKYFLCRDLRD